MTLSDQKQPLFRFLQTAIELELSTIPPYLTALLSIEKQANRVAANLIRSVIMEEMLHMALVGNLISSLGGRVHLGPENIPSYPLRMEFEGKPFKDRAFSIDLAAFSPESLQIFMQIEVPASLLHHEALLMMQQEIDIPGITIGEFYGRIISMLEKLCADFPEADVFIGDPKKQINEQYYWGAGGKPVIITNLATAREALDIIIDQGEGGHGSIFDSDEQYFNQPEEVAHYFRFKEIALGQHYRPGDTPDGPPTGKHFSVDYQAVYPIKRNAKSTDYQRGSRLAALNDAFNSHYSLMLCQLEQVFNGTPSLLYDAIINGMRGMTPIANEMMSLRIDPEGDDIHGAPSFEWVEPLVLN